MSWKVEVIADNSGKWCGNNARYPDEKTARLAGMDLAYRWTLVSDWRVVESDEPANWELRDGAFRMIPVEVPA